jgi:hypothetical protein
MPKQQTPHVGFDEKNGKFEGLPQEWDAELNSSGIGIIIIIIIIIIFERIEYLIQNRS